jgi:hypothetical protein
LLVPLNVNAPTVLEAVRTGCGDADKVLKLNVPEFDGNNGEFVPDHVVPELNVVPVLFHV